MEHSGAIVIGTAGGLREADGSTAFEGRPVRVFDHAAIVGGTQLVWHDGDSWQEKATARGMLCVADAPGGLLVGTEGAHLLQLAPEGLARVEPFEHAPGKDEWYTPWGGPPDTRSIAVTDENVLLVNVHVGGIVRSADGGRSWSPTIDVHADVHQVVAVHGRREIALASAAVGLCRSADGGMSWTVEDEGLHATYCRAIAVGASTVYVSASEGPRGRRSAIYRAALAGGALERISDWIEGNVDSGCLAARGDTVAYGTVDGRVMRSDDRGDSWAVVARGLDTVLSVTMR
jgi:hypothetical protein